MVGHCELIFGSMYCGKTEELLRRLKRAKISGQQVLLFKPFIDNRYGENVITTHSVNSTHLKIEEFLKIIRQEFSHLLGGEMNYRLNSFMYQSNTLYYIQY